MMKTRKLGIMLIAAVLMIGVLFAGAASADSVAVSTPVDVKNTVLGSDLSGTMASNQNTYTVTFAITGDGTLSARDGDQNPVSLPLTDVPQGTLCTMHVSDMTRLNFVNESSDYTRTVFATPKTGSHFLRWDGVPIAGLTITGPVTITAVFEKNNVLEPGTYTADQWNAAMKNSNMYLKSGTYTITGTGCIEPRIKVIEVDPLDQGTKIILDFSTYKGTFKGYEGTDNNVGALFGKVIILPNKTLEIKGLNLISVNVVSSQYPVGGIIGYIETAKKKGSANLIFTDCHLVNCSIEGYEQVGGLIGNANSMSEVIVDSCSAEHSDFKATSQHNVGGLVGTGAQTARFTDCFIAHSTICAQKNQYAGGLAASSINFIAERCSVEDTSVYAKNMAGGLTPVVTESASITECTVKNSVIAGSISLGGFIGLGRGLATSPTLTIKNSQVIGSTIAGWKQIGGLVGDVNSNVILSGCSGNSVVNCAVKGDGPDVNLDCGTKPGEVGCTADLKKNYLYQGGQEQNADPVQDTITLRKADGTECDVRSTEFWHTIYDTNASSTRGLPSAVVTSLKTYGRLGGYGISSAPSYSVTYNKNGVDVTGAVPQDTASYLLRMPVTLAGKGDLAKSGYTFSGWNTRADGSGTAYAAGSFFRITEPTTMYAQWTTTGSNRGHSASIPKDYTPSSSVPVMVQETAKPTTAPTVAAPTAMPTTKPTSSTSKSPAPFVGLIAGLGIAGLVLNKLRK